VFNAPPDHVDGTGDGIIADLFTVIPGIGTLVNLISSPSGSDAADYNVDLDRLKSDCCRLGPEIAELYCVQYVAGRQAAFLGLYVGYMVAHDLLDGFIAVGTSGTLAIAAIIDAGADTIITIWKISNIRDGGTAAAAQCDCSQF
jgi:hypothetical protein